MCIGVSTPPSKTPPPLSCQAPLKLVNCPSPPFSAIPTFYIGFSWTPPLKVGFFSEPKILKFFIPIPSYLLKGTKFLGKISYFEFLVITKNNNIFPYKLFLSLNISDFNLLSDNCNPPEKKFPAVLSSPLFFKFGWRLNPRPLYRKGGGGVHTM